MNDPVVILVILVSAIVFIVIWLYLMELLGRRLIGPSDPSERRAKVFLVGLAGVGVLLALHFLSALHLATYHFVGSLSLGYTLFVRGLVLMSSLLLTCSILAKVSNARYMNTLLWLLCGTTIAAAITTPIAAVLVIMASMVNP